MNSRDLVDLLFSKLNISQSKITHEKVRFEALHGKIFPTDPFYQERTYLFLEWFLCDSDDKNPPLLQLLNFINDPLLLDETVGFLKSYRSIFELMEPIHHGKMWLRDMIGGGEWVVDYFPALPGFRVGDHVDARLRYYNKRIFLGAGFVFHPPSARDAIHNLLNDWLKKRLSKDEILSFLSRLHVLSYRFSHLPVERIYSKEGLELWLSKKVQ